VGKTSLIVTDKRLMFDLDKSEGSSGLEIKHAAKKAEAVLDTRTNALREDAVAVPLGDRVNVKRIAEAELSANGISVPDSAKSKAAFGVVVGVGQGRYNLVGQLIPLRIRVGAVVMFGRYAGTDLPLFGIANKNAEPLLCLREEEIMQVIMTQADYEKVREQADPEIVGVSAK
jgi:chaperonin GroES